LEIGQVNGSDYYFWNWLGIKLVIGPSITKIVTGLELRTTIVIVGNQTRNGSFDYQNANRAGNQDYHYRNGNWKSDQGWFL